MGEALRDRLDEVLRVYGGPVRLAGGVLGVILVVAGFLVTPRAIALSGLRERLDVERAHLDQNEELGRRIERFYSSGATEVRRRLERIQRRMRERSWHVEFQIALNELMAERGLDPPDGVRWGSPVVVREGEEGEAALYRRRVEFVLTLPWRRWPEVLPAILDVGLVRLHRVGIYRSKARWPDVRVRCVTRIYYFGSGSEEGAGS